MKFNTIDIRDISSFLVEQELFGDVGPLVRASLLRPGVAEVIYVQRSHALKAVEAYHNRQLDGLPMHCSLASGREESRRDVAPPSSSKSSMYPSHSRRIY